MKERQIYVENVNDIQKRTRVFAGSAGTTTVAGFELIFDAWPASCFVDDNDEIGSSDKDKYKKQCVLTLNTIEHRSDGITSFKMSDESRTIAMIGASEINAFPDEITLDDHLKPSPSDWAINRFERQVDNTYVFSNHAVFNLHIIFDGYRLSQYFKLVPYYRSKFVNSEGNLTSKENACTYCKDIDAVRQYLLQHLAVIKHELWYNYEYGLPIFEKGLTKAMIDAEVAMIIYDCNAVESILSFESTTNKNHEYHLSFSVMTKYGKLDLIDTL